MSDPIVVLIPSSPKDAALKQQAQRIGGILKGKFAIQNVKLVTGVPKEDPTARTPTLWIVLQPKGTKPPSKTPSWARNRVIPTTIFSVDSEGMVALQIAKLASLCSRALKERIQAFLNKEDQRHFIQDVQLRTQSPAYSRAMASVFDEKLQITGKKVLVRGLERDRGKVRDKYSKKNHSTTLALVTTDRQSGFDRQLAVVPYKGAVLNLTSEYWFDVMKDIIPNHIMHVPHPNISVVKACKPFPVEFVVRGYMTGSTDTSIWKHYERGVRTYCGHKLPNGMKKNQQLEEILLTPTTKAKDRDVPISAKDVVAKKLMKQHEWDVCAKAALQIFQRGQELAAERGLILVDTKYEFGKDVESGEIRLIDEIHTPDSSRWWLAHNYQERFAVGKEPDNISKEFLRVWYREHCNPYKDKVLPEAPRELVLELSRRYIALYEMITGQEFDLEAGKESNIGPLLEKHLGGGSLLPSKQQTLEGEA